MTLFVDSGNTAVKFAIKNNNSFHVVLRFSSSLLPTLPLDALESDLKSVIPNFSDFKTLLYSSSRPKNDSTIEALATKNKLDFYQFKKNLNCNLDLLNPDHYVRMGADLLLYAYQTKQEYPKGKAVVVSIGTATTLTFLQDGVVQGCQIGCGLMTASRALSEKAQMIDVYTPVLQNSLFGLNTEESLNLGLLHQHFYGIEKAITLFKKNDDIAIFICGGDGYMILPLFKDSADGLCKNLNNRPYLLFEALENVFQSKSS